VVAAPLVAIVVAAFFFASIETCTCGDSILMRKQAMICLITKSSRFYIEDISNIITFFYDNVVNIVNKTWNYSVTGHHLFNLSGKLKQSASLLSRTLHEVRFIRIKKSAIAPSFNTSLTTMKRADVYMIY
jgi:hypothetical protein